MPLDRAPRARYLPVGRFTESQRDKEQYLADHCINWKPRKRPFNVVTCAKCGTEIYRGGPLWASTGGNNYCSICAKEL